MNENILVYGAGVIGSVYALRFAKAGFGVDVLARGERLASIRENGIVIRRAADGEEERAEVDAIDRLAPGKAYALILLALRSGQIKAALADISRSGIDGPVLALGNNLESPAEEAALIGEERLVLGFGVFGGYRESSAIVYLGGGNGKKPGPKGGLRTTAGILSEKARPALEAARRAFARAGLGVRESGNIADWLLCHAALVFPLAGAIYAAAGEQARLRRSRDALLLGIRACKELMAALPGIGCAIEPKILRALLAAPEWLLAPILSGRLAGNEARVAIFGHANAPGGRDEICGQALVLDAIVRKSGRELPSWDALLPFFLEGAAPLPEGSRRIRLRAW